MFLINLLPLKIIKGLILTVVIKQKGFCLWGLNPFVRSSVLCIYVKILIE